MTSFVDFISHLTPIIYATGIYSVFRFLDEKSSDEAKTAITQWFTKLDYNEASVAQALVEVFDRIYTYPLFALPAFLRSAAISIGVTLMVAFEQSLFSFGAQFGALILLMALIANVLSDYVSLFFVRWWLKSGGHSPIFALITGPLVGAFIIILFYALKDVAIMVYWFGLSTEALANLGGDSLGKILGRMYSELVLAAVAVHLWLPLFELHPVRLTPA